MFYAVAKGRQVGVYNNWDECSKQVTGYKGGPKFKKFKTIEDARKFISDNGGYEGENSVSQPQITSRKRNHDLAFKELPKEKPAKEAKSKIDVKAKDGFLKDENEFVCVYTDGACSNNGEISEFFFVVVFGSF